MRPDNDGIPVGLEQLLIRRSRLAAAEQNAALRELRAVIEKQNAIAKSTVGLNLRQATRLLADTVSGQIGQGTSNVRTIKWTITGDATKLAAELSAKDAGPPSRIQRVRAWLRRWVNV